MARPRKSRPDSDISGIKLVRGIVEQISAGVSSEVFLNGDGSGEEPNKKRHANKLSERYYKENKQIIRTLNPGAKVEYSVQYASQDNNAVFVAARVINSLGYDFFNYKDIFKQDFLTKAGYTRHYTAKEEDYWKRASHIQGNKVLSSLKDNSDKKGYSNLSSMEATEYNKAMVKALYPILWEYCSGNIIAHAVECTNISQSSLYGIYNDNYGNWLFDRFKAGIDGSGNKCFSIHTPIVIGVCETSSNYNKQQVLGKTLEPNKFTKNELLAFREEYIKVCSIFEQLSISLIKDCCLLINQIKMNQAAGRDIMYSIYNF